MVKQNFPAALRAALESSGVSQSELARRLGTTPATISRYLAGTQEPVVGRVEEIGAILGCVFHLPGVGYTMQKETAHGRIYDKQQSDK